MKNYLHYLYMITKFSIYGFIIQCFLFSALMASEGNAQVKNIQEVKMTISLDDATVQEALAEIEVKTGFSFVFNENEIKNGEKIFLEARDISLADVLEEISKQAEVSFKQVNQNISVKPITKKNIRITPDERVFQGRTITGKVTSDDDPEGLPGVNIILQGTDRGTVTDLEGNYSLEVDGPESVLVFSSIGFVTEEVRVGNQSVVNMLMVPDITALEEIVVVGYGTQKKSDLTGAVSSVNPEEMTKQATNDVTQMMQGRVAGVSVTSDGQPGAAPAVRVRGVSTFGLGAGAEPLYVVDGYPMSGGIRDINPNDIESIQVLKDATAGAIYGNRAANGVVIITTKGGRKNQEFTVGFNAYYGLQTIPQRLPLLQREGYQDIMNEALINANQPLLPGNDPNSPEFIDDIDTDWQDAGYKDGYIQNYNLNLSGGTEKSTYYLSLDFLDNAGTLVGSGPDYKRYSFRVNSETQLGRVKIGENVYGMKSDENPLFFTTTISIPGNRPSLVNDLVQAAPTIPLYDENRLGGFGGADQDIHQSITLNVPGLNTLIDNSTVVNRILANVYGEVEIIDGLTYKLNLQYDNTSITDELFVPEYDLGYFFPGPTAQYQVGDRQYSSFLVENTLRYENTFNEKHYLNVMLGQSYQDFESREIRTFGSGLEAPYILSLGSAANISATDNQQPSSIASLFGRVNYTFDDRYLLTVNVRRDGSSRFNEDNRYEVFPSVGLAWKIHNDFNLPTWITDLKLRGGYGQLGNQEIGNFRYLRTVNRAIPYQFGPDLVNDRVLGAAVTILTDAGIQWETRTTSSIALDAVLLDGRLEFTAEYYDNTSDDVLMDLPIPGANGSLEGLTTNAGSIKNSGIELSAAYRQSFGDFDISIEPNFYTVNNEVLDLGPLENIQEGGARTVVGRSIGEHYGYVYEGIFQDAGQINTVGPADPNFNPNAHAFQTPQTAPGDVMFADLNDDGSVNDADRDFLGNGLPTYYYGINIVANFMNFDFTFFGSGSGGNLINSNIYRGLMGSDAFGFTNRHEDILGRWTPENTDTDIPRMIYQDPNINGRDSDRPGWLQKGDYFRINTISLGYTLPEDLVGKIKMKSARVYVTLQNVHTFMSYKGYNPDFQSGTPIPGTTDFENGILNPGFDYGTFPRPRTTMFGVQIKF